MTPEERMAAALREHPEIEIASRTARYLAGDLEEGPVADEPLPQITFRLPDVKSKKSLEDRADALVEVLGDDAIGRVTRAAVFRKALDLGLQQLESEHLPKSKTKRKR